MLAGSAFLPGLTPDSTSVATPLQNAALYVSLYVVALGTGGIKPNVSAFGADQFDELDPRDRKEKKSFFNWFYFSINVGSLLAVTGIVWIQENVSWAIGFVIPAIAMAVAVVTFIAGSPRYRHVKPSESPISRVYRVTIAAWRENRRMKRAGALVSADGSSAEPLIPSEDGHTAMHRTPSLPWLDSATQVRARGGVQQFTTRQVEEVKLVYRMLPIFFATILYWTIYMQMSSFLWFKAQRWTEKSGAMFAAAIVERKRLALYHQDKMIDEDEGIVDMSVWYQIPQYLLIGMSEIFASIGQMEFFYDQAPDVMRSCSMALQLLSVCIGSYLSGALVFGIQAITSSLDPRGYGWLPKNLNKGRLDLFLITLGMLMLLNLLHFMWVAAGYEYKAMSTSGGLHQGLDQDLRDPLAPLWTTWIFHQNSSLEQVVEISTLLFQLYKDEIANQSRPAENVPPRPDPPTNRQENVQEANRMDVVRHSRPLPGVLGVPIHVIGMSFGMIAKLLGVAGNILSMIGRRILPRRIQRMLGGLRRALLPRVGPADPTAAAADFIQGFSAAYGERCPRWQISSWEVAAQKAQADGSFLFVYLHSPRHQDTATFCRNTLCSPAFVDYLNSTFVSWGGNIRSPDAFRLASSLRVSKYPYCALLAFSGARTRLITFAEGNVRPEALAELLQAALVEHNGILWEERLIHEQRSHDRRLREEQDAEYQRSLEADRAKELERQRQEEELRRIEMNDWRRKE
eukprot:jgi/Picre1/28137/NNA_003543.t1